MGDERRSSDTRSIGNIPAELSYQERGRTPLPSNRVDDRRMWYVKPGSPLCCYPGIGGHRIPDADIASAKGPVRCHAKNPARPGPAHQQGARHGAECGALLYVLWLPDGLRFVAQITHQELTYMQNVGMRTVAEVLDFLGACGPLRAA